MSPIGPRHIRAPRDRRVRDKPSRATSRPWFPRPPTTAARRRDRASSDLICGAGDGGFAGPGSEVMVGVDPEYVALAGTAQRLLDITHTIDAVGRHPGERDRLTVQRGLEVEVGEEVGV